MNNSQLPRLGKISKPRGAKSGLTKRAREILARTAAAIAPRRAVRP